MKRFLKFIRWWLSLPFRLRLRKELSELQVDVILHLGRAGSGSDTFQATMESLGLDYHKERQVGKFNAELVRLKVEGILFYKEKSLYLTNKGWGYHDVLQ